MARTIVVLSGSVAAGKTTLADSLELRFGAFRIRTQDLLIDYAQTQGIQLPRERRALQEYGTRADSQTGGRWLSTMLPPWMDKAPQTGVVVVDSIRVPAQLDALRDVFGRRLIHIHLTAPETELSVRYGQRRSQLKELKSYEEVKKDSTEAGVEGLGRLADLQIDTLVNGLDDVVTRCAARVGLLPPIDAPLVDVLVGGQYGSEGKGNIAYYLAPEYDVLVRVGGPNAGHKVPSSPPITHRSLPSGTTANRGAQVILGAGSVIALDVLAEEIKKSKIRADRLHIDPNAVVIEEADRDLEDDLRKQIGSTGQGVGQATARRITQRGQGGARRAQDVAELKKYVRQSAVELLEDAFSANRTVLLEGTQGTGLSLYHGRYPHVTSRDTTVNGCLTEAGINSRRVRRTIMVVRSYPIRVNGDSGQMGREIDWETVAERGELDPVALRVAEHSSVQNKLRRVAEFDWSELRRSAQLNGPSDIALTFADYLHKDNRDAFRYDQLHRSTQEMVEEIEAVTSSTVSLIATRFDTRSIIDRRRWRGHVIQHAEPSAG